MFHKSLILLMLVSGYSLADYPGSFSNAKTKAEKDVYFDQDKTFYCKCDFVFDDVSDIDGDGNQKETMIIPEACGYKPRIPITGSGKPNQRATRIEWEHVMPAQLIGGHLDEWKNKEYYAECRKSNGKRLNGRDCAYKLNESFRRAHNDMNNLVPVVGELNGDRSNFQYQVIPGEQRAYGACDFEVDFKTDTAEPADSVKGDVARVYLHMNHTYGAKLDTDTLALMQLWDRLDSVDSWECERNKRIILSQGLGNQFVASKCTD